MDVTIIESLEKNIKDIIHYDPESSIENITVKIFETILKLERDDFLSDKSGMKNKANGYYSRLIKSMNKYCRLEVPRDRIGMFQPVFLDILNEQEKLMQELAFKLYVKGLSTRDVSDIFSQIYNKNLSPTSVSNITKEFEETRKLWLKRKIESEYYFIFIDALYIPIRRDNVEKEPFYIAIGLRKDLKRDILGVYNIPTETKEGWRTVFQDLKNRGLKKLLMVTADGLSGLESSVEEEFPGTLFQKCLVHKIKNVIMKVRASSKEEIKSDFWDVFRLESENFTPNDGVEKLNKFLEKWSVKYPSINNLFKKDQIKYYFSYANFHHKIQRMIYSTNWSERLNKEVRKTQRRRNSFPNPESALNLICAFLKDYEEKSYNKYPISSFQISKEELDKKLENFTPWTHNT